MRTCSACGKQSGSRAHYCVHCEFPFPEPKKHSQALYVRKCSDCGAPANKWAQHCYSCNARLPSTYSNHRPRTPIGEKRQAAQARMLEGMRGPACVCGCRGPHECTRTPEWKQETMSLLAMRQL